MFAVPIPGSITSRIAPSNTHVTEWIVLVAMGEFEVYKWGIGLLETSYIVTYS